jgi:hypothetical protein
VIGCKACKARRLLLSGKRRQLDVRNFVT